MGLESVNLRMSRNDDLSRFLAFIFEPVISLALKTSFIREFKPMNSPHTRNQQPVWTVSALNFEIKTMLEKGVGSIWIEGEISNFAQPASGHWYFSLKDPKAQLRAAMFRNRNGRVGFQPENGQQVLIRAQVTLYEARGDFQVIVEHMEPAGTGLLMRRFEELKQKLDQEGLFSDLHKQAIPDQAHHVGLITSATGAAIRDALSVIKRRSPATEVTVFKTAVQGDQAPGQIINAIEAANRFGQCDVLLLIRGGGSLEDLWGFNDEAVARAIFASDIPVVSGVGHEIDYTIADFVADARAPTPSVAAEMVSMDQYETMMAVDSLASQLIRRQMSMMQVYRHTLESLNKRLLAFHPKRQLSNLHQRLRFAQTLLVSSQRQQFRIRDETFKLNNLRLINQNPQQRIEIKSAELSHCIHQLESAARQNLSSQTQLLALHSRSLDNLSPLKTLSRGFAAVTREDQIIQSADQLQSNDPISIRFQDGIVGARVE